MNSSCQAYLNYVHFNQPQTAVVGSLCHCKELNVRDLSAYAQLATSCLLLLLGCFFFVCLFFVEWMTNYFNYHSISNQCYYSAG